MLDRLREFRENLVDERTSAQPWTNPEQGSQDTSKSSHELPMEQRAKVEPGSGKHSAYTHFREDPNCEICLELLAENAVTSSCPERKISVT